MKHRIRLLLVLLICLLPFGCGSGGNAPTSSVWNLGKRYPVTYGTLRRAYTYQKDHQIFYLSIAQSKNPVNASKDVIDTSSQGEITCSLLKSNKQGDETKTDYTFYQGQDDTYRYFIGKEESGLRMETLLSMEQAIALIRDPETAMEGLSMIENEWSAYYRLESCNLEISVFPSDGGEHYRKCESTYESRTEGSETYLLYEADNSICYTNGTDTVLIHQSNRAGMKHTSYNTVSECKAILALLRSK